MSASCPRWIFLLLGQSGARPVGLLGGSTLLTARKSGQKSRKEFEVELVRAKADFVKAEADLRKAEAHLDQTATDEANSSVALEKARAQCRLARAYWRYAQFRQREARTALAELNHVQPIDGSEEGPDIAARPAHRDASPRSAQSSEHPVRNVEKQQGNISQGNKFIGSFALPRHKYLVPEGAPARRLLAEQSVMLLALALAYLQYDFVDVHLQIALLPSLITMSSVA